MQDLFMKEAEKHHVLPLDDRTIERTNPTLAGRPDLLGDRKSLTLYDGMQGMLENTFMNVKNRLSKITPNWIFPLPGQMERSCRRVGASVVGRCS
jgi:arylsulfatase